MQTRKKKSRAPCATATGWISTRSSRAKPSGKARNAHATVFRHRVGALLSDMSYRMPDARLTAGTSGFLYSVYSANQRKHHQTTVVHRCLDTGIKDARSA